MNRVRRRLQRRQNFQTLRRLPGQAPMWSPTGSGATLRIYSNVMQIVDSPGERELVIFGARHLGWLQHDFASDSNLRLRKLAEFER